MANFDTALLQLNKQPFFNVLSSILTSLQLSSIPSVQMNVMIEAM